MRLVNIAMAATATMLTACHNGSNNARDTTGMPNNTAAGSMGASGTRTAGATTATTPATAAPTGAIPRDTTHRDSIRKQP